MTRKAIYSFKNSSSLGIDIVPLNSFIHIQDILGKSKTIVLISITGLNDTSTIQNLLDLPAQYESISVDSITDLENVYSSMSPVEGQALIYDVTNGWQAEDITDPTITNFTATSGQTTFTLNYNVSNIEVYAGGVKVNPESYIATNGTSIVFNLGVDEDTWIQVATDVNVGGTVAYTNESHTFTLPQRTTITPDDNNIDFTQSNNISLTATSTDIGTPTVTGCTGQAGVIIISSAENITGWDSIYNFKTIPTDLIGEEVFSYFIQSETIIRIGRLF